MMLCCFNRQDTLQQWKTAVSYTHLDVYKRQMFVRVTAKAGTKEAAALLCEPVTKEIVAISVSYTHLDVYKRQEYTQSVVDSPSPASAYTQAHISLAD